MEVRLKKNQCLFSEGQFVDAFYVVAFGKMKIFRLTAQGEESIIHIHADGDSIAEAAIFDDERYPANGVAIEESLLVKIPSDKFKKMIKSNPDLSFKIMSAYAKRIRLLNKKIQHLTLFDIKARLANFLLLNCDNGIVILNVSKKDLAADLGTIPETLSRSLAYFKNNKIIEVQKDRIIIKNTVELKKMIPL